MLLPFALLLLLQHAVLASHAHDHNAPFLGEKAAPGDQPFNNSLCTACKLAFGAYMPYYGPKGNLTELESYIVLYCKSLLPRAGNFCTGFAEDYALDIFEFLNGTISVDQLCDGMFFCNNRLVCDACNQTMAELDADPVLANAIITNITDSCQGSVTALCEFVYLFSHMDDPYLSDDAIKESL